MSDSPPGAGYQPGTLSPDRKWIWNGVQWVHVALAQLTADGSLIWNGSQWVPNAARQWVPKKSHTARNAGIGVVGCIGLVIIGVIALAALGNALGTSRSGSPVGSETPSAAANQTQSSPSSAPATGCSPAPCASAFSLTIHVTGINRSAPPGSLLPPEPGNHMVVMQVKFHNDGGQDTKTISPFDFKLRDAAGVEHDITFSDTPGCDTWSGVDLAPGASYGPKPLCFEASGSPSGKLTLLWTPDLLGPTQQIQV